MGSVCRLGRNELDMCIRAGLGMCVVGPDGVGKKMLLEECAQHHGARLITIGGGQIDTKALVGNYVCTEIPGEFVWRLGILSQAMKNGYWILIRDLGSSSNSLIMFLNFVQRNRRLYISGTGEYISAHENFRILGTSDRMIESGEWTIFMLEEHSETELVELFHKEYPECGLCTAKLVAKLARELGDGQTLRKGRRLMDRIRYNGSKRPERKHDSLDMESRRIVFDQALDVFTMSKSDQQTRREIGNVLAIRLGLLYEDVEYRARFYRPVFSTAKDIQIGACTLARRADNPQQSEFTMTDHSLRLLEKISQAIRLNEACLLVGETGTGKTSMVQYLANLVGVTLQVVNLHGHSEGEDLIGGYRPGSISKLVESLRNRYSFLISGDPEMERWDIEIQRVIERKQWEDAVRLFGDALEWGMDMLGIQKEEWGQLHQQARKIERRMCENHKWFSFVEGALVQAITHGHWILLDEINLASAEVLEILNGILSGPKGSIMLHDRGDCETLCRHPDFRLFGCMNPNTDVGKRNLPQGLMSRFTEIFVDDFDLYPGDLKTIIRTKLLDRWSLQVLEMGVECLSQVYLESRSMVRNGALVDNSGHKPHLSLRTLLRGIEMAGTFSKYVEARAALCEGINASFVTQLDTKSQAIVTELVDRLFFGERGIKDNKILVHHEGLCHIGGYPIPEGPEMPQHNARYIITATVLRNLQKVARVLMAGNYPILLQGPTSSGKTSVVEHLALATGNHVVRINNHEGIDLQEYLGSFGYNSEGQLVFTHGLLVRALRNGNWVLLDELNLAPSDVLESLNRLLDDNREIYITETEEWIRPHANFRIFATQNPPGGLYGGRKFLSRAFRNRFVEIHFDELPGTEISEILRQTFDHLPASFCQRLVQTYQRLCETRISATNLFAGKHGFITLRDLFKWGNRKPMDTYQGLAWQGYFVIAEKIRNGQDKQMVKEVIEKTIKVEIDESRLYNVPTDNTSVVWTKQMKRMYLLVEECIRNQEAVMLVGETGCGKTRVCEILAQKHGKKLYTLNCHQYTEASDFLGMQRPSRIRGSKSPFEWQDGPLIRAMKEGNYLLIDEISLVENSVLERLNSVLEASRTICLYERPDDKCIVRAHKDFVIFATMNPGGDFGKKELSPALRNRFTEIWVSPLDMEDVEMILEELVAKQCCLDGTARQAVVHSLRNFIQWYSKQIEVPGIRSLEAWILFIERTKDRMDLEMRYIHGGCMLFVDPLGVDSTQPPEIVQNQRIECLERLQFESQRLRDGSRSHLGDLKFPLDKIGKGLADSPTYCLEAPTVRENLMRIWRGLQIDKPILLEGHPGVGKTSLVSELGRMVGKQVTRINLSDQTDPSDLFGMDVPVERNGTLCFEWRDGPLLTALRGGEWVLLDEINLASQLVLEGLNSIFDHRGSVYIPDLDQSFGIDWTRTRIFATQNPRAQGGHRKGLPKSFLNRFTKVVIEPFKIQDIKAILVKSFGAELEQEIENGIVKQSLQIPGFNLRDAFRMMELYRSLGQRYKLDNTMLAKIAFSQAWQSTWAECQEIEVPGSECVSENGGELIVGHARLDVCRQTDGFVVLTKQVRSIQRIIHSIHNKWMMILEGEFGVGKRTIVDFLARVSGIQCHYVCLTPESDTFEFLGSYEQTNGIKGAGLFEWKDGVLIRAMQQGDWIVFENANACPASVMDRLNGVFEPERELYVHEKAGPNKTCIAHENFRAFLIVDPRHGELSLAMRNRGLRIDVDGTYGWQDDKQTFLIDLGRMVIQHVQEPDVWWEALYCFHMVGQQQNFTTRQIKQVFLWYEMSGGEDCWTRLTMAFQRVFPETMLDKAQYEEFLEIIEEYRPILTSTHLGVNVWDANQIDVEQRIVQEAFDQNSGLQVFDRIVCGFLVLQTSLRDFDQRCRIAMQQNWVSAQVMATFDKDRVLELTGPYVDGSPNDKWIKIMPDHAKRMLQTCYHLAAILWKLGPAHSCYGLLAVLTRKIHLLVENGQLPRKHLVGTVVVGRRLLQGSNNETNYHRHRLEKSLWKIGNRCKVDIYPGFKQHATLKLIRTFRRQFCHVPEEWTLALTDSRMNHPLFVCMHQLKLVGKLEAMSCGTHDALCLRTVTNWFSQWCKISSQTIQSRSRIICSGRKFLDEHRPTVKLRDWAVWTHQISKFRDLVDLYGYGGNSRADLEVLKLVAQKIVSMIPFGCDPRFLDRVKEQGGMGLKDDGGFQDVGMFMLLAHHPYPRFDLHNLDYYGRWWNQMIEQEPLLDGIVENLFNHRLGQFRSEHVQAWDETAWRESGLWMQQFPRLFDEFVEDILRARTSHSVSRSHVWGMLEFIEGSEHDSVVDLVDPLRLGLYLILYGTQERGEWTDRLSSLDIVVKKVFEWYVLVPVDISQTLRTVVDETMALIDGLDNGCNDKMFELLSNMHFWISKAGSCSVHDSRLIDLMVRLSPKLVDETRLLWACHLNRHARIELQDEFVGLIEVLSLVHKRLQELEHDVPDHSVLEEIAGCIDTILDRWIAELEPHEILCDFETLLEKCGVWESLCQSRLSLGDVVSLLVDLVGRWRELCFGAHARRLCRAEQDWVRGNNKEFWIQAFGVFMRNNNVDEMVQNMDRWVLGCRIGEFGYRLDVQQNMLEILTMLHPNDVSKQVLVCTISRILQYYGYDRTDVESHKERLRLEVAGEFDEFVKISRWTSGNLVLFKQALAKSRKFMDRQVRKWIEVLETPLSKWREDCSGPVPISTLVQQVNKCLDLCISAETNDIGTGWIRKVCEHARTWIMSYLETCETSGSQRDKQLSDHVRALERFGLLRCGDLQDTMTILKSIVVVDKSAYFIRSLARFVQLPPANMSTLEKRMIRAAEHMIVWNTEFAKQSPVDEQMIRDMCWYTSTLSDTEAFVVIGKTWIVSVWTQLKLALTVLVPVFDIVGTSPVVTRLMNQWSELKIEYLDLAWYVNRVACMGSEFALMSSSRIDKFETVFRSLLTQTTDMVSQMPDSGPRSHAMNCLGAVSVPPRDICLARGQNYEWGETKTKVSECLARLHEHHERLSSWFKDADDCGDCVGRVYRFFSHLFRDMSNDSWNGMLSKLGKLWMLHLDGLSQGMTRTSDLDSLHLQVNHEFQTATRLLDHYQNFVHLLSLILHLHVETIGRLLEQSGQAGTGNEPEDQDIQLCGGEECNDKQSEDQKKDKDLDGNDEQMDGSTCDSEENTCSDQEDENEEDVLEETMGQDLDQVDESQWEDGDDTLTLSGSDLAMDWQSQEEYVENEPDYYDVEPAQQEKPVADETAYDAKDHPNPLGANPAQAVDETELHSGTGDHRDVNEQDSGPDEQAENVCEDGVSQDELVGGQSNDSNMGHKKPRTMQNDQANPEKTWARAENDQTWTKCLEKTYSMSLELTERWRLLLEPTQMGKLRGDYKSGKRLNMKRVISYIASGFKKDKIWMRRTKITKRNYQIMLSIDQSFSMRESGASMLVFETLALVSQSLARLEVGELGVMGFGDEPRMFCPFSSDISIELGTRMVNDMRFQDEKTKVVELLDMASSLLEKFRGNDSTHFQIHFILSDGMFPSDTNERIRQQVARALDKKILTVFLILDARDAANSILEIRSVVYQMDANNNPVVSMKRYLDSFPSDYYVVIRDIGSLPLVLSGALEQWLMFLGQ